MKIHIEGNLYLESDQHQYLIKEYSGKTYTNKKGEEIESSSTLGYYGTINQALNSLIEMKIRESNATTLKELLEEVRDIKQFVKRKVNV